MLSGEVRFTLTLSRSKVAYITNRSYFVAATRFTIREVIVSVGALFAMGTSKVWLARALSIDGFAVVSNGSVQVTLARSTIRVSKVPIRAGITIRWVELRTALTTTGFLLAITGGEEVVAVTGVANVRFVPMLSVRAIELALTLVTVDTFGVVLTILTDATSFVVAVDVQRELLLVNFFRVDTFIRMAVTVAGFTLEWSGVRVLTPLLLLESRATICALNTARIVLTLTCQNSGRRTMIQDIASIGVTVTHTTTSDRDILDRVEVSSCNGRILTCDGHQMTQKVLCTQQPNSYVSGTGPLLECSRVEIVVGRRAVVQQHHWDLTILQWNNLRVFGRTDHIVIVHDRSQAVTSEIGFAIGGRIGKMLPRLPRATVIHRLFQCPQSGTGRITHTDEQVRYVEFLSKVNGQVDLVVLHASR